MVKTEFLRAYQIAGVDYLVTNQIDTDFNLTLSAALPLTVPFSIGVCHGNIPPPTQYTSLFYDPSISAIFTGVEPVDAPNLSPSARSKSRLNPAAYAVPVAVVVVALAAIVIALITVPSLRARFLPILHNSRSSSSYAQAPNKKPALSDSSNPNQRSTAWRKSDRPADEHNVQ